MTTDHEDHVRKLLREATKGLSPNAFKDKEYKVGKKTFVRKYGKLPYEKAICNTGYQCYAAYRYSIGWHGSLSECGKCGRVYVLTNNGWEVSNFRQRHASGWSMFICAILGFGLMTLIYTVFGLWWF
jgi:hypothetical protein